MTPGKARQLWLATTNPAKAERLRWVFDGLGFSFRTLPANAGEPPEETGRTFRENAELKAVYYSRRLGGLAAASDGGMAVPALGPAWNALRTARAAGPAADDLARARYLLGLAERLHGEQRRVSWSEGLALARDGELLASWESRGTTALLVERLDPAALKPGFWAASLCYLPERGMTLAGLAEGQLPSSDPTWTGLRDAVRRYVESGQSDAD